MSEIATQVSSILYAQHGLQKNIGLAGTLLGGGKDGASLGYDLLSNALGQNGLITTEEGLSDLESFILENVPESEKFLADLAAVKALSELASQSELSSTSAFLNPYQQILSGAGNATPSILSLLV